MDFLREDSPLAGILARGMDLVLLNLCFLAGCIPLFTIGASLAALYEVSIRLILGEEPGIAGTFFRAFVKNLRRGTALFLLTAGAGAFLLLDFWSAAHWDTPFRFASQVVILSVGYFYAAEASHVFPVLAYFGEPIPAVLRRAFVLAMRNGVFTVFIMLMNLLPFLLFFLLPQVFWRYLFVWLTFGFAFLHYLCALHLVRLFAPERVKEQEDMRSEREARRRRGDTERRP